MIHVQVIGRLGADAEVRTSQASNQYLNMRVAVDNYRKGEKETLWVNVMSSGDRTLKIKEFLTKGRPILVYGTLQTSIYSTKSGENAISYDVNADRIDFIPLGQSGNTQSTETVAENPKIDVGTFKPTTPQPKVAASTVQSQPTTTEDDDLPF